MRKLTFLDIQKITTGTWITSPENPNQELSKGAFDTRSIDGAEIFFCWKGENSDGHQYVYQLHDSTINLIIVEQEIAPVDRIAILQVKNSLQALHDIARELSRRFSGRIISITGSSGKTTAKTWLCHLLKEQFNVLTNTGSFNNHIGCPITILSLDPDHEVLLLEMGTSGLKELDLLSSIAPSDLSVLLNVGHAHLGKFGSLENTYRAKLEIFSHQRPGGLALIPFSDKKLRQTLTGDQVRTFGTGSPDLSWELVRVYPERMMQIIRFHTPYGEKQVAVQHLGNYVGQLLSAIFFVCHWLGLPWPVIEKKISSLPQEKGRSQFIQCENDVLVLDDTYNANPESVVNMLETICMVEKQRYVGIVGNLAELDDNLSESAGFILDRLPVNLSDLFLLGESGRVLAPQIQARHPAINTKWFDSIGDLMRELDKMPKHNLVIGVKGSRSSHMERIVYLLTGQVVECNIQPCFKLMMCKACAEH